MNKVQFIERIAEFDNFDSKRQAKDFVEDVLSIIKDEVIAGNDVSLAGFGKFTPFTRQDGKVVPKFRPFEAFVNAVADAK